MGAKTWMLVYANGNARELLASQPRLDRDGPSTPTHRAPRSPDKLAARILRFLVLLAASWVVMTMTHEMGHVVGGWCSGGQLQTVDLLPWHLPYSLFNPNPKPLVTLWCGPILGVVVPLGLAFVIRRDWSWFVAGFCALANGVYLALAWFSDDRFLDTPQLLEHGANPLWIGLYCLLTIGFGYPAFRRACIRCAGGAKTGELNPKNHSSPSNER